uniref:Uncharacterized protein n=1 Tax=Picea glauca TaxID=3330 RepID=A0A101LUC9_PICGL|nr:hypothetical protein ABT39_MTgene2621 [Picea glauca]QHR88122.1 hypothetical protein Q903MT_gene2135 [Picea sitchensis]
MQFLNYCINQILFYDSVPFLHSMMHIFIFNLYSYFLP